MGVVLVVDDDADLRNSIKRVLEDDGHEVITASDGREALTRLNEPAFHPSVMVLDLMMPVMNGWQLLDIFARDRRLQKIPVILTSAYFGNRFVADPHTMLRKPFKLDRLLELVAHHCDERPDSSSPQQE